MSKKPIQNRKKLAAPKPVFTAKTSSALSVIVLGIGILIYLLFFKSDEPKFKKEGELNFLKSGVKTSIRKIDIEIANNAAERTQGLMYRKSMDDNHGMLFVFEQPDFRRFWMKNTYIPLDIAFVDSAGVIDTIYRNTKPLTETALPSRRRVQYVVEVNGGFSDKNGVKEGDLITFETTVK